MSKIEWTDETWNPTVGCSRVSEGCRHCYAERQAFRNMNMGWTRYEGTTVKAMGGIRWTGVVRLVPEVLDKPLHWKKPRRIFVNSMSDLFHEALDFQKIAAVYGVMACAKQHTFQVLTKRPQRRLEFQVWLNERIGASRRMFPHDSAEWIALHLITNRTREYGISAHAHGEYVWPLPNVWEGVSVEDQGTADARIPLLLQTGAARRFVSYEPALGPIDFLRPQGWWFGPATQAHGMHQGLDWVIVGGESGPGARPFDVEWARSTIKQCRAAGVACFVKQVGAFPVVTSGSVVEPIRYQDRKGGDPSEWTEDLRVREFPS